jgi:ElaA protein
LGGNPLKIEFFAKTFSHLTVYELYEIVRSRQEIFLMEQNIVCRDFDGVDYDSLHCFLMQDGKILAYLRAYESDGSVKIGRVLSLTHRIGLGRRLMEEAMPIIMKKFGKNTIILHSQCQAEGFYLSLGFVRSSPVFLEEGIEHVEMRYEGK